MAKKKNSSNLWETFSNASEIELDQFEQAWRKTAEAMKPMIVKFNEAKIEAENYLDVMNGGKTLSEMTAYCNERPLSPIAAGYVGMKAKHGASFKPKRKAGALSETTKYINGLVIQHPDKSTKELLQIADTKIIGQMADTTFANKVSKAKKSIA